MMYRVRFEKILLCTTAFSLILTPLLGEDAKVALSSPITEEEFKKNEYTINFANVAAVEFVRFASRISGLNFVFEEKDLDFTVTVLSEEPISSQNVLSALAQVLRAHNLFLLENGNNILIVNTADVNELPALPSQKTVDYEHKTPHLLVTRVFRIKYANLSSLSGILRRFLSKGAAIETSLETRQLIITDIATNVEKIASLMTSLDNPNNPLEIESYSVKHSTPQELITLTQPLILPFTDGAPFNLVGQEETNSIFIASTPYIIERAMAIFEDLDKPHSAEVQQHQAILSKKKNEILIYSPVNKSSHTLVTALKALTDNLRVSHTIDPKLLSCLETFQWQPLINSLIFIGDPSILQKVSSLLQALDSPTSIDVNAAQTLFIYKIKNTTPDQIHLGIQQLIPTLNPHTPSDQSFLEALHQLQWNQEMYAFTVSAAPQVNDRLKNLFDSLDSPEHAVDQSVFLYKLQHDAGHVIDGLKIIASKLPKDSKQNQALLEAIQKMHVVPGTNNLILVGAPSTLELLKKMIADLDAPILEQGMLFVYEPQFLTAAELHSTLSAIQKDLEHSEAPDHELIKVIISGRVVPSINSIAFTGTPTALEKIKVLLSSLDTARAKTAALEQGQTVFLYKLQYNDAANIIEGLQIVSSKLPKESAQNQALLEAIPKVHVVPGTNNLLLVGSPETLELLKKLIADLDTPSTASLENGVLFVYEPQFVSITELKTTLESIKNDLERSENKDVDLIKTITSARVVSSINALAFTGTPSSLEKLKSLLASIDISKNANPNQATNFIIYHPKYVTPQALMLSLQHLAEKLPKDVPEDAALKEAINNMRYMKDSNSLYFVGPNEVLQKLSTLLSKLDSESPQEQALRAQNERNAPNFVIYSPQYVPGQELISILHDFEQNLKSSGVNNPGLFDVIKNLRWIDKSNSLLISGGSAGVAQVEELIKKFDSPNKGKPGENGINALENTSFLVYKLQYHQGTDILNAIKQVSGNLETTSNSPSESLAQVIHSLQYIQVTNSLVSTGNPAALKQLKKLIASLDIPLRQVFIEILVIQTTLNNTQQFGLMWGGQAQYMNKASLGTGNFPVPRQAPNGQFTTPVSAFQPNLGGVNATNTPKGGVNPYGSTGTNGIIPFTSGFDLGVIGDIILHKGKSFLSLGSLVNAIQLDSDSTIVMNPKIITQDNKQSNLFVGQNIPFAGAFVSTLGQNSQQNTSNLEYRDVGVTLTITPMLGDNDTITLDIVNDISQQIPNTTPSNSQELNGIQTSHTHMETRIHVPNNHFIVLSGLLQDTKTRYRSAIPCLGGLPVIGALFSENDRRNDKFNVMIFLRPQIIDSGDELKKAAEHQQWLYKDSVRLPAVKEDFDEGIDWVKLPENE